MKHLIYLTVFFSVLYSSSVNARIDNYYCKVLELQEIYLNGEVGRDKDYQKEQIGSTFSVNRKTGKISGLQFINNETADDIKVYDSPNNEYFYVT